MTSVKSSIDVWNHMRFFSSTYHRSSMGPARNCKKCSLAHLSFLNDWWVAPAVGAPRAMHFRISSLKMQISFYDFIARGRVRRTRIKRLEYIYGDVGQTKWAIADYANAIQRNHNIIFEFLKQFCKFSFYDFHFIISFGLGGATSINRMCSIRGAEIADRAIMNCDPPTCKN